MLRRAFLFLELLLFSALLFAARCADYPDVFVNGEVYFTDADCYSRMTRVRLCAEHPGLVLRHHAFENFPSGITPHTTAPFDYAILALAWLLKPFSAFWLDLAGALISPVLGLCAGWFLWWWTRRMQFRCRAALLLLYSISPILVHGAALGRPDHQSFLLLTLFVVLGAEWLLQERPSQRWSVVSGLAWGLSLWISLYEPLILLAALAVCTCAFRGKFFDANRRIGWLAFALVLLLAAVIERRGLAWPALDNGAIFRNWAGTIGELKSVGLNDGIWLHWLGYGVILAPLLLWLGWKKESSRVPPAILVLLAVTFLLTIWQARWGYFFAAVFVLTIPAQIAGIRPRWLAGPVFILLLLPVLRDWDERLWPDESHLAARLQDRREHVEWRQAARSLGSDRTESFLAPWWLAPSAVYWSGQPAVAGSSHESLPGIADSARFFLATDDAIAREILMRRGVRTVLVGHADEVAENSAAILAVAIPRRPLCAVLDATPSQAPRFLVLTGQNAAGKIFRVDFTR